MTSVLAAAISRGEGDLVQNALHHRLQTAGADILNTRIHRHGDVGNGIDRVVGKLQRHAFGASSTRCTA